MRTPREGAPSLEQIVLLQPEAGYHYTIVHSVPRWRRARRQEPVIFQAWRHEFSIWTLPISVGGLEEVR